MLCGAGSFLPHMTLVEALAAPASVRPTSFYSHNTRHARHQRTFSFPGSRAIACNALL